MYFFARLFITIFLGMILSISVSFFNPYMAVTVYAVFAVLMRKWVLQESPRARV